MTTGRLAGRTVLVTGASAGIGRETARRLARSGAAVLATARDGRRLAALADEAPGVTVVAADLVTAEGRATVADAALSAGVDALVNNAGVGLFAPLGQVSAEQVERLMALDVLAPIDLSRRLLPAFFERGKADIVNVSSIAAWASTPSLVTYCAAKSALDAFGEGLRREVWGSGVLVHGVNPGPVRTEWLARATGYEPEPGAAELATRAGVPAGWVAAEILRCLRSPWPRRVAVPRGLGVIRLGRLPVVRQLADVAMALGARASR